MAGRGKGLLDRLVSAGARLAGQAAERVMSDPRGQDAIARAVGVAQRGRKRFEALQASAMKAAGIPGRQDYDALAKQLARLKRKARELSESLDARPGARAAKVDEVAGPATAVEEAEQELADREALERGPDDAGDGRSR
jgi:hypothetical protein